MNAADASRNGIVPVAEPDGDPTRRPLLRGYGGMAIVCMLSLCVACLYGGALVVLFEVPIVAIWLIYSVVVAWVRADRRAHFARKLLIGALTVAAMIGIQAWLAQAARRDADAAVAAVETYRQVHGAYPETLDVVGIGRDARRRWGLMYWPEPDSRSYDLNYASAFSGFDRWIYDRSARSWHFQPD